METPLTKLLDQDGKRTTAALNVLVEAPYFYREDDEELFFFMRRHRHDFSDFFAKFFGWGFVIDDKCARVHKGSWFNAAVKETQRDLFGFRRRDECLGFMLLLEFFEHQLDENSMTVEERDNLHFRLGDLLAFMVSRFAELYPQQAVQNYTEEKVRKNVLRPIMPALERYRLLRKLEPPKEMERLSEDDFIYEALPALYHYNVTRLCQPLEPVTETLRSC